MADRADGSPAEESVGSARVTRQGNPPARQRKVLGQQLDALAEYLRGTYERLKDDWPKQEEEEEEVADYWRNGLEEVKIGVVRCQRQRDKCWDIIQPLPDVARKHLDPTIEQFSTAIREAKRTTLAAIHALESRQEPAMRASLYDKAVDQLWELRERCTGLATQMYGETGLPAARPPAAPETGGPQ